MSRMPPVPAASQPPYGPGAVPKTFTTDLSQHADLPFPHQRDQAGGTEGSAARKTAQHDSDRPLSTNEWSQTVVAQARQSDTWMLVVLGAVVAAIFWVAGRQKHRTF